VMATGRLAASVLSGLLGKAMAKMA
jgi:hypothetical protein